MLEFVFYKELLDHHEFVHAEPHHKHHLLPIEALGKEAIEKSA
jgi:hypothetical protein